MDKGKNQNKLYKINQEESKEEIVNIVKENSKRIEIENIKKEFKAEKDKILKFFTEMTIKSIKGNDETNIISTLLPQEQYLDTKRSRKGQNPVYFYEDFQSPNQEKVALKLVELPLQNTIKTENCLREEYSNMLRCCWNPKAHVIRPLAFCHNSAYVGILMKHGGIPLDVWWKNDREWSIKNIVSIFQKLASGLNIIHSQKIFHGDIKPGNILIEGKKARFTDFGTSLLYDCTQNFLQTKPNYEKLKGFTILYTPPEITIPRRTNTAPQQGIKLDKIDIFALAFTIYSVLIKGYPMVEVVEMGRLVKEGEGKWKDSKDTYPQFLCRVKENLTSALKGESPVYRMNLSALISRCLDFDPYRRPSCVEILTEIAKL